MADATSLRRTMVDAQIRPADVTDRPLIAAFLDVPREHFVPPAQAQLAYLDLDLPAGAGARRLLKPMVLAKMLQALDVSESARALDVGCGGGYAAAVLSLLCASVVALEEDPALVAEAKRNLAGSERVTVTQGRLADGHASGAPYDVILVEGCVEVEPERLCAQLADGGQLVCILGSGPATKAALYRRDGGDLSCRQIFDAAGTALPGFSKSPAFAF